MQKIIKKIIKKYFKLNIKMIKNMEKYLKINVKITDTEEFEDFKCIIFSMLRDDRIDKRVRNEYYNKVIYWLDKTYPED